MELRTRPLLRAMALVSTATLAALTLTTGPAEATVTGNDDFTVYTTDGCGAVDFVDYGDNALIHDYCGDGHGVMAYAWIDGYYLGAKYNGNGLNGAAVSWDPFGDVLAGELVGLKVCLVDGASDPSPSKCASASRYSIDG